MEFSNEVETRKVRGNFRLHPVTKSLTGSNRNWKSDTGTSGKPEVTGSSGNGSVCNETIRLAILNRLST